MADTSLLKAQMAEAKQSHVYTIGQILMELARMSERAAELIEQDLAVPEMSLEACGKVLKAYARKNQEGGCWACGGVSLDADNPAIKVILDFYKIPSAWVFEEGDRTPSVTESDIPLKEGDLESGEPEVIDLMDLL